MKKDKLCIIGLGYVGLPLAVLFSSKYDVVGYDYNSKRVAELKEFNDKTNEVSKTELRDSQNKLLRITSDKLEIRSANIYIITVPTPIDSKKEPDLSYLISATSTVASNLNKGDIVKFINEESEPDKISELTSIHSFIAKGRSISEGVPNFISRCDFTRTILSANFNA